MKNYEELMKWRLEYIRFMARDHQQLNMFHDQLMRKVIDVALEKVKSEWGPPPAHFTFFLMGSAGRFEQAQWSDQDHGIIYEGSVKNNDYFLKLGAEISKGLAICGYELCDGKVMASNPLWCQSLTNWKKQVVEWLETGSWDSLRNFTIFFDSRELVGNEGMLRSIKDVVFQTLESHPHLLQRLLNNVGLLKKGIGVLGQLLTIEHGEEAGSIQIKKTVLFPYVNALRLFALKEKIYEASTLSRFRQLPTDYEHLRKYEYYFSKVLSYRLIFQKDVPSYKKIHYLNVNQLGKQERLMLKKIMKNGYQLFNETKAIINKGD